MNKVSQTNFNKIRFISAAALVLFLAACGGGSGGSPDTPPLAKPVTSPVTPPGTPPVVTQQAGDYTFSGTTNMMTGLNGKVAVVTVPDTFLSSSNSGTYFTASSVDLSAQVQQSNYGGAFTTLSNGNSIALVLSKGSTIADIGGVSGVVAVGRWTAGSDSQGGNYTVNQGAPYAVGMPLTVSPGTGTKTCSAIVSTSPSSASGNVSPGKLNSATATLDMATLQVNNFTANVTIGSDTAATITKTGFPVGGVSMGGGVSVITRFMGIDVNNPLIAIGYAGKLATTGDVNGLVVLSCS
ncbi:hypothetical protein A9R05_43945 (plasmid) [Burkholderia sp. KK1]|uniref:Lipoprotein transmembrane n=1 Tax=Burkholderia sp. M701 TaxID=326454 RepID=V5YNK8_9BURK|nr:hypothetical protein [Burkholderia sp. M701]AQH05947.1 hypothetical protein A9R05_43945 [Burkholderia sp. KK1]BAO19175.1 putative lipoprotein transmembrane [Burkholderia sp. M701]